MRSTQSCPRRPAMNESYRWTPDLTRRAALRRVAGAIAASSSRGWVSQAWAGPARGRSPFPQWVDCFRPRAMARGVSEATYTHVMGGLKPDTSVYALDRSQPEFTEKLWQYLNRRVSDWRITEGRAKAKGYAALLDRIEQDFGVSRAIMLGLWGVESAYGDPDVQKTHMRP